MKRLWAWLTRERKPEPTLFQKTLAVHVVNSSATSALK